VLIRADLRRPTNGPKARKPRQNGHSGNWLRECGPSSFTQEITGSNPVGGTTTCLDGPLTGSDLRVDDSAPRSGSGARNLLTCAGSWRLAPVA